MVLKRWFFIIVQRSTCTYMQGMAVDGEDVCTADSPCAAVGSTFLKTPTLATSKSLGMVHVYQADSRSVFNIEVKSKFRLSRVERDSQSVGE